MNEKNDYIQKCKNKLLETYIPQNKPEDYDEFWDETIEKLKKETFSFQREPYPYPGNLVRVWSISFTGFEGQTIYGWMIVPQHTKEKLPCMIRFHGGQGYRENPSNYMAFAAAGFAVVTMDPRGQGGMTQDNREYTSGANGRFILRGILNKEQFYLRGLYMDCVRAVEFASAQPEIDSKRIVVEGSSQGGACAMAAAAFSEIPALVLPNVPSFCCFRRRIENRQASLQFVADYLSIYPEQTDQVLETLSYFDVINLADHVNCPVYAAVGLKDVDAPAEYFIGAYHHISGPKEIEVYPFNHHRNVYIPHFEKALSYAANVVRMGCQN